MSTTDTVLLIIVASLMSIFFLLDIVAVVIVIKLLSAVKRVVAKAENVVDSVEDVAETFAQARGRLTLFKLVRNIIKIVQRSHK
jgi:hypothetical protein